MVILLCKSIAVSPLPTPENGKSLTTAHYVIPRKRGFTCNILYTTTIISVPSAEEFITSHHHRRIIDYTTYCIVMCVHNMFIYIDPEIARPANEFATGRLIIQC